jgi:aminobenzoyl-glutamate utilization protein B
MTRAGLFRDVDIVLHWHPRDRNQAIHSASLANKSAKFRFHGESAHAAVAPERGRSALDGVEAMNHMVNLLREHVPEPTRIHYVITRGGEAPNVVPEFAEVFYYVRHPDAMVLAGIWERIAAAAQGAALGTGTRVEHEIIHGVHSLLPNETLAQLIDANLRRVGGVQYDASEQEFARTIYRTLSSPDLELGSEARIQPLEYRQAKGSTDVGDVSWNVPTGGVRTATWVPGTPPHSWQAVAAGGTSIGTKAMINAAKVLAFTAMDLFTDPELVARARAEFEEHRGRNFRYVPMLGDREPPLDYRR